MRSARNGWLGHDHSESAHPELSTRAVVAVTPVTISANNPRSIKAIEIAAGAGQWLTCHTADGAQAYGIPSQREPGRYYLVTCQRCSCPDAQRHPLQACKHQLGVRLYRELAKAQQQANSLKVRHRLGVHATPADYARIFQAARANRRQPRA